MIEKIVNKLANDMEIAKIITKEQIEHYIYAMVILIEKFIIITTVLLVAIIKNNIFPTLVFWTSFMEIRKRTNGYHADSFLKCYFGTVLIYLVVVMISPLMLNHEYIVYVFLVISTFTIEFIGTVNHPNMNLTSSEYKAMKKTARYVTVIEVSIIGIMILLDADSIYINYMSFSIILCAALLCVSKILDKKNDLLATK